MLVSIKKIKDSFKPNDFKIDDKIFWLSTTASAALLIIFSSIVSSKQFFGNPISCFADGLDSQVMNSFCWIQETFTVVKKIEGQIGVEVAQPGVSDYVTRDEINYHSYYQWVCFVLFFQALCFYFPHHLWMTFENKLVEGLLKKFNTSSIKEEKKEQKIKILVDNLAEYFSYHTNYSMKFFFCEFLAFLNLILQVLLVDCFLDWEFSKYGVRVLSFMFNNDDERIDPMVRIFPKVTKCLFHDYGVTGTIQKFDVLCVLPLNIVNEKIFIFLWFWLIFIFISTTLKEVFRVIVCFSPTIRMQILRLRTRKIKIDYLKVINEKSTIDDWFLLYQISKNISRKNFTRVVEKLAEKLKDQEVGGKIQRINSSTRKSSVLNKILYKLNKLLEFGDFLF